MTADVIQTGVRVAVVVDPHSSNMLTSCSHINMLSDWLKALATRMPIHATMVVPNNATDYELDRLSGPGLTCAPIEPPYRWSKDLTDLPMAMSTVSWLRAQPIDVIINRKLLHTPMLMFHLQQQHVSRWTPVIPPDVLAWIEETGADPGKPLYKQPITLEVFRTLLHLAWSMVISSYDKQWLLQHAVEPQRRVEVAQRMRIVRSNVTAAPIRARREALQAQRAQRRQETGQVVLLHGGTTQAKMRVPWALQATDKAATAGAKVRFVVITMYDVPAIATPLHDLIPGCNRERWLSELHRGDLIYVGSEYEGTGLAMIEAVASGMLPLVRPTPWVMDRIPEGYPLVAKDVDGIAATLMYAAQHFEALRDTWLPRWDETLAALDSEEAAQRSIEELWRPYLTHVRKAQRAQCERLQPAWGLLLKAVEHFRWPSIDDPAVLREGMRAVSAKGFDAKYLNDQIIRVMALAAGYRDRCDGPRPRLVWESS